MNKTLNPRLTSTWRAFLVGLAGALTTVALSAGVAGATTGPGYLIKPPKDRISLKILKTYTGRYVTSSIAPAAKIRSSELYIGVAESGYGAGGISLYSYNAAGTLQTFAGTLYNFHAVGPRVEADIVGAGGQPVLGHLFISHKGSSRNLVGEIQPPSSSGRYAIAYRFAHSGGPLPGQANAPTPGPPNSGTVSGKALGSNTSPNAAAPKSVFGWGPTGRFLGRYHVTPGPAASSPTPTPAAGIFTVALSAAAKLSATAQRPTGGQLSLFMRTVKKTLPPEPSGILSLQTPSASSVVYLTMLKSAGTGRTAEVHGGSFLGPQIGAFSGASAMAGSLSGKLTASGIGTFALRFTRFSTKPAP